MRQDELSGPDLDGVGLLVPDGPEADEAIIRFLDRIGATRLHDGKTLAADDVAGAHHLRVNSHRGIVDIMRGGMPPLSS
jgi:hypothetical protein